MSLLDDDIIVEESMTKEVIELGNKTNQKYMRYFEGWVNGSSHRDPFSAAISEFYYVLDGVGNQIKRKRDHFPYEFEIRHFVGDHMSSDIPVTVAISTLSTYKDKNGIYRYKINNPKFPIFIKRKINTNRRSRISYDDTLCRNDWESFTLDVPAGTKEVTFLMIDTSPSIMPPKVNGDVKVNIIRKSSIIKTKTTTQDAVKMWFSQKD